MNKPLPTPLPCSRLLPLLLALSLIGPALADNNTSNVRRQSPRPRPAPVAPPAGNARGLPAPVSQPQGVHALVRPLPASPGSWHNPSTAQPGQMAQPGNTTGYPRDQPPAGQAGFGGGPNGAGGVANSPPRQDPGNWHGGPGMGGSGGGNFQGGNGPGGDPRWHGSNGHQLRVVRRLPDQDRNGWNGGAWHHENRGGYDGWWWVVAGSWYFYSNPVYPYPDSGSALMLDSDDSNGSITYDNSYQNAPAQVATAEAPEWYYCQNPQGYYPQVPSCSVDWTPVPAQQQPETDDSGAAAASSYWYYCDNPQGYYPYVASCNNEWQAVAPSVDQAATAPQPAAPAPVPAAPAPQAQPNRYWYYCQNPAGYYPTVPSCPSDWIPVPAKAAGG